MIFHLTLSIWKCTHKSERSQHLISDSQWISCSATSYSHLTPSSFGIKPVRTFFFSFKTQVKDRGIPQTKDITLQNVWLMRLTAVTLWVAAICTLVESWKGPCFIVLLLSEMSLIKFSTVVVRFEDKCFLAGSGVLSRVKTEQSINAADVSSNVDYIFLCRCVWVGKEIGMRTAASGILQAPSHIHSLADNIWGLSSGSIGSRCSCHWLFSTVIKLLRAARHYTRRSDKHLTHQPVQRIQLF